MCAKSIRCESMSPSSPVAASFFTCRHAEIAIAPVLEPLGAEVVGRADVAAS